MEIEQSVDHFLSMADSLLKRMRLRPFSVHGPLHLQYSLKAKVGDFARSYVGNFTPHS